MRTETKKLLQLFNKTGSRFIKDNPQMEENILELEKFGNYDFESSYQFLEKILSNAARLNPDNKK